MVKDTYYPVWNAQEDNDEAKPLLGNADTSDVRRAAARMHHTDVVILACGVWDTRRSARSCFGTCAAAARRLSRRHIYA